MAGPIESWLKERPRWLQTAFALRIAKAALSNQDYDNLASLCASEAAGIAKPSDFKAVPTGMLDGKKEAETLRFKRIESLTGINALKPSKPLEFGKASLEVIYGPTGSGKTGYTRLLRHACGSRFAGELHQDAFSSSEVEQSATFVVQVGTEESEVEWCEADGPSQILTRAHVFDSERAISYLKHTNEPTFEPFVLQLFSAVISDCGRVESRLLQMQAKNPSKLPMLPPEFYGSACVDWYRQLSATTTPESVETLCKVTDDEASELRELEIALSTTNPADVIVDSSRRRATCDELRIDLEALEKDLAPAVGQAIRKLRKVAKTKRDDATKKATRLFSEAPLEGIGQEEWRRLWEAARAYSEEVAYPGQDFPVVKKGSVCVLCQQELKDGAARLAAFEKFLQDALEDAAQQAEADLEAKIEAVPDLPPSAGFVARFDAVGNFELNVKELHKELTRRRKWLLSEDKTSAPLVRFEDAKEELKKFHTAHGKNIANMELLQKDEGRAKALGRQKDLNCRKWFKQQKKAIELEIARRKALHLLDDARRLTDTTALTKKRNALSEQLLAKEHEDRFVSELRALGGSEIPIRVRHERADKAAMPGFALALQDAKRDVPVSEVLSDGESRVVALANFLADVTAGPPDVPFIFDDPISSLDYDFEVATARRLVVESLKRQVIVFTHRLSLIVAIGEAAKKAGIEFQHQCLRIDASARGTPADSYLSETNLKKALNRLKNERLAAAKSAAAAGQHEICDALLKSICMDLRVLLEALIERVLLSEIVIRFRRDLVTKNRLERLTLIKKEDCLLLDDLMTAYSFPMHSQASETPLKLPTLEKTAGDLAVLIAWCEEFSARK